MRHYLSIGLIVFTCLFEINSFARTIETGKIKNYRDTIISPIVRIGNFSDTSLTVEEILSFPYLNLQYNNSNFSKSASIFSFKLLIRNSNKIILLEKTCNKNLLSKQQLEIIKRLSQGSTLYFSEIKVVSPNGRPRTLQPFTIVIK